MKQDVDHVFREPPRFFDLSEVGLAVMFSFGIGRFHKDQNLK